MGIPESFSRLCHSYLGLADRFQQLDVECMELKTRLVPLLHSIQAKDEQIRALSDENHRLKEEIEAVTAKYSALKALEGMMSPELNDLLQQAEAQADLVDETLQEMDHDGMPGMSAEDRQILQQFTANPVQFTTNGQNGRRQS
ncbi:MAG: hypothetical protein AAF289_17220 [Cyanobacteria bacterium P01_A01_bin.135]